MAGKSKTTKGSLQSVRIEPGNNGYAVHAHHQMPAQKPGANRGMAMPFEEEKPSFFNNRKGVVDHINQMLAAHEGTSANAAQDSVQDGDSDDQMPRGRSALRGVIAGK